VAVAAVLVVLSLLSPVALVWAPKWVSRGHSYTTDAERIKLENSVRGIGLQALAGGLLLVGAFFTARTFRVTAEGHITDRYSTAVDKLKERGFVEEAGILALERIALDSKRDHPAIIELLVGHICRKAPRRRPRPRPARIAPLATEVQLMLTVLGRRQCRYDDRVHPPAIKFSNVDLSRAVLDGGDFAGVEFSASDMREASFVGTHLRRAIFTSSDLADTDFLNADLRRGRLAGAVLWRAKMLHAKLDRAILNGSSLIGVVADQGTSFKRAELNDAELVQATLTGANLRGVQLHRADLREVLADHTKLVRASLREAKAAKISLVGANLRRAKLQEADLTDAVLAGAKFRRAGLRGATLHRAVAVGTSFKGADLRDADLSEADLRGANLRGANLGGANVAGVQYDADTNWPAGFNPPPPQAP